jgi:cytochrome c553
LQALLTLTLDRSIRPALTKRVCSACHGFGGNLPSKTGPRSPAWIRYISSRHHIVCGRQTAFARNGTLREVRSRIGVYEIAAYFAAQKKTVPAQPKAAPK